MSKQTLDGFFTRPSAKKVRLSQETSSQPSPASCAGASRDDHPSYPWSMRHLPNDIKDGLELLVTAEGKAISDQPDLDLLYFQPFIPQPIDQAPFESLRSELFFYRVQYTVKPFGSETQINTPRYTTVFDLDETDRFVPNMPSTVEASDLSRSVSKRKYKMPASTYSGVLGLSTSGYRSCNGHEVQLVLS
jgi:hypothetical protein